MNEELLPQKEVMFMSRGHTPIPERSPEYLKERFRMIGGAEESITELVSFEPFQKLMIKKTKENNPKRSHPMKYIV